MLGREFNFFDSKKMSNYGILVPAAVDNFYFFKRL